LVNEHNVGDVLHICTNWASGTYGH